MIFDSHAHLISSDKTAYPPRPLRGELTPGEFDDPMTAEKLLSLMDRAGVVAACAVQRAHVYGYENDYILDCAAKYPDRFRAVVVLNAADPTTPGVLRHLVRERGAAGVRYVSPSFPTSSLDWVTSTAAQVSWSEAADLGIPVCVHVLYVQREVVLPAVHEMASKFPSVRVVVDHVGGAHPALVEQRWLQGQGLEIGPEITDGALALADLPNVVMKFSDINLECTADSQAFIDKVIRTFGVDRLIWGSDIGQSKGDYLHMVEAAKAAVARLDEASQKAVLFDNAKKLYWTR